ncbi:MAG TPA: T9SS type A sorting domain-containing protein [Bacteroidales bacterium]|nr:T9SS type A sorting domain-containing protein [Bacteroidales bacterium]
MKKYTIIFFFIVQCLVAYSQDGVTTYPDPVGYDISEIRCKSGLGIDAMNNKWVAYDSIGLGKFDGTGWTMFDTLNSQIPSNKMTSLFVDNNVIYAGTKKGLGIFDGDSTWTVYNTTNGLLNNQVNAINYRNGILWVGTNKGLAKYNGSIWTYYYSLNSAIPNDTITAIEFGINDTVWIGTIDGLCRLYNDVFTIFDTTNSGLNSSYISCLKKDMNNNLWIGTSAGAYRMRNNVITPLTDIFNIIPGNNYSFISSIDVHDNYIYIPGYTLDFNNTVQGIFKINSVDYSFVTYYCQVGMFSYAWPFFLCSDTNDIIWIISSFVPKQLRSFNYLDGEMYDNFDLLSINNVKARFNAGGQLFWDLEGIPTFEVPKGSGKNTLFSGALWVGGKDTSGLLHMAAERYQYGGNDFFPGPVMDSAYYNQEQEKWNRVWKLKKTDIEYHWAHCFDPGYVPSHAIASWPGNGDTTLGQAPILAPFKDWNNDGIYNPYAGDFPLIKGDETVLFIFNDDRKPHADSKGNKLRLEVIAMAYSFDCEADSALWNTVFLNYKITNRSSYTYDSSFIGIYVDTDLGDNTDDYIGCDVTRGAFYTFNGDSIDGSGWPQDYGANPPAQAIVFLSGAKMDDDGIDNPAGLCDVGLNGFNFGNGIVDDEHLGMSTFMYFTGAGGLEAISAPDSAAGYYNYLKGNWKDGIHMQYWGFGYPSAGATGPACNYQFPGDSDPCNWGTGGVTVDHPPYWTEEQAGNPPFDRRGMGSTGPFTFNPGDMQEIDFAFVYGRDFNDPNELAAIPVMNQRIDSIRSYFKKDQTPCGGSVSGINDNQKPDVHFNIYPNPANDLITIETNLCSEIEIFDIQGQLIKSMKTNGDKTNIDISGFSRGMYFVKLKSEKKIEVKKFMKQ